MTEKQHLKWSPPFRPADADEEAAAPPPPAAAPPRAAGPKDALDRLAEAPLEQIAMLLFWRERFRNPEMSVHLTEADLQSFKDCVTYLDVKPQLSVFRPQGRPAQEATPASPGRRAVPARAAEPPRAFVFVGVVDQKGDLIKPIESTEDDAERRDRANAIRRAKEKAPQQAALLLGMCQSGTFSNAEIQEAASSLTILASAA